MLKVIGGLVMGLVLSVTVVTTVFAEARGGSVTDRMGGGGEVKAQISEKLKTNALREIDRRVVALNELENRLRNMKRISETQKNALTAQVEAEVASLTELRAKIVADTDMETLKADKKSIVDSYRIFVLFMPKVTIMAHADRLLVISGEMKSLMEKYQVRIDSLSASGKETGSLISKMSEMRSQLELAEREAGVAIKLVENLEPEGYSENKSILTSAKESLKRARESLRQASEKGKAVRVELKSMTIKEDSN